MIKQPMNMFRLRLYCLLLVVLLMGLIACQKEEITAIFRKPTIEIITAFAINDNEGEVNIDISDVFQEITEAGLVYSERSNPTLNDASLSVKGITSDQLLPL